MAEDRPVTTWTAQDIDDEPITVGGDVVEAPPAPALPAVPVTTQVAPVPTVWNTAT